MLVPVQENCQLMIHIIVPLNKLNLKRMIDIAGSVNMIFLHFGSAY
jgi:hypothetical protein